MISPQLQIFLQCLYFTLVVTLVGFRQYAIHLKGRGPVSTIPQRISCAAVILTVLLSTAGEIVLMRYAILKMKSDKRDDQLGVPPGEVNRVLMTNFLAKFLMHTLLWLDKAILLCLYYDLSRYASKRFRYTLHSVTVFTIMTFFICIFLVVFWCRPVSRNWTYGAEFCSAWQHKLPFSLQQVANIITDLMLMALPYSIIKTHPLTTAERRGLYFVFLVGILAITAASVRFGLVTKFLSVPHDPSKKMVRAMPIEVYEAIGQAELMLAFMAALLPSMRVVLNHWIGKWSRRKNGLTESGKRGQRGSNASTEDVFGDGSQIELASPKNWKGTVTLEAEDEGGGDKKGKS